MRHALVLVLGLAVGGSALGGCETTQLFQGDPEEQMPEASDWQETEPLAAPSFEVLWDNAQAVLESQGYAIDSDRTDFGAREIVTKWRTNLAQHRFQGVRRRAHVAFVPAGDRWVVRASVIRQRNADIDDPSNPAEAQWERVDGPAIDATRTALLVYRLRSPFDPELHPPPGK